MSTSVYFLLFSLVFLSSLTNLCRTEEAQQQQVFKVESIPTGAQPFHAFMDSVGQATPAPGPDPVLNTPPTVVPRPRVVLGTAPIQSFRVWRQLSSEQQQSLLTTLPHCQTLEFLARPPLSETFQQIQCFKYIVAYLEKKDKQWETELKDPQKIFDLDLEYRAFGLFLDFIEQPNFLNTIFKAEPVDRSKFEKKFDEEGNEIQPGLDDERIAALSEFENSLWTSPESVLEILTIPIFDVWNSIFRDELFPLEQTEQKE